MNIIIFASSLTLLIIVCLFELSTSDTVYKFEIHNERRNDQSDKICPNKRTKCQESQTCCKTKHNSYHCCRYRNAVCCPDRFHCCPEGSTCDTETKRCSRNINFLALIPSKQRNDKMEWEVEEKKEEIKVNEKKENEVSVSDITCPNNKTKCKETKTCCITKHGNYYCCPHKNAVCCSDKWLCCAEGTTCDIKNKKCLNSSITSKLNSLKVQPEQDIEHGSNEDSLKAEQDSKVRPIEDSNGMSSFDGNDYEPSDSEVTCPNNKTTCKDTKTCCITNHGNYYCCPHKNAVCCSDKWSCCPDGSTCDIKNKKCNKSTLQQSTLIAAHELTPVNYEDSFMKTFVSLFLNIYNKCVDSNNSCPNNSKCCAMKNGKYGCCGFLKGTCCSDYITCCPQNTECDIEQKVCVPKMIVTVPSQTFEKIMTHICPDNKSECYSWETCCPIGNGEYGCCPHINATCCSDKVSCCPYNTKCDLKNSQCINVDNTIATYNFLIKSKTVNKRKSLQVFLENKKCEDNNTFCPMSHSKYGCCPYKSGECCADLTSCCPIGTKCSADGCLSI